MKNLRVLLAAALPLLGAGASLAQSPPPSGLFPTTNPADVTPGVLGPGGVPAVVVGENASPSVPRMWFNGGWSLYWASPTPVPHPLVTTSDPADQGIVGNPTTAVLLGQQNYSYGRFSGFTFSSGGWWNPERTVGMDGSTVWSEYRSIIAGVASDGNGVPALYRPFIDAATQNPSSFRISEPGLAIGSIYVNSQMNFVNSDGNLMLNLVRDEGRSLTALIGYRIAYVREQMFLSQTSIYLQDGVGSYLGTPLLAGDSLNITDRIETVNRMYVGQFGLRWERNAGPLTLGLTTKLGFGWSNQRIYYDGRTTLEPDVETAAGGIIVQRSLPDRNQLEQFVFVPDVGLTARMRVSRRLHATFAYNLTWFSNVARPGNYIDPVVELTQVPSDPTYTGVVGTRPKFFENDPSLFIHGVTFGLTWTY